MRHARRFTAVRSVAVVAAIGLAVLGLTAPPAFAAVPSITSFSPTSGPAGTTVTITGTFTSGTVSSVKFGGTAAFSHTTGTSTTVSAVVPAGATTGVIEVTDTGGTDDTTGDTPANFTVTALPAPTVTAISPTCGAIGSSVTITGTHLIGAKFGAGKVTFTSSKDAVTWAVSSDTQVTATVPTGAVTGVVKVTTDAAAGGGGSANTPSFAVSATCPTITSFTPTIGGIGTPVTITGTNFTGATGVKFNLTAAVFTVASATSITTSVPAGATTGKISVTTPSATATSSTDFTVIPAPTITSFTPTSGNRGTLVTINGTNFSGTNISVSAVSFNGVTSVFSVLSANQITATVPSTATSGPIKITSTGGTVTSSTNFTVTGLKHARKISIGLNRNRVSGSVTASGGFAACENFVPVAIQHQKASGAWRLVELLSTNRSGNYAGFLPNVPGKYRAVAVRVKESGETCSPKVSRSVTL